MVTALMEESHFSMYFKKLKEIITDTILMFFQNVIYFCFAPPKKERMRLKS